MHKPPLSDDQSRHLIVTDLDRNLLVEAGAGSGKTHMMAARMAAGIASGKYQIEHMAAVTFTRKAASELRGRFQLALEDRLSELQRIPDPGSRITAAERLNAALSNLERFFAGTIHSFCAHLLRERPVESGLAPGFSEIDETEGAELRAEAWRDFLAHARTTGHPLLQELRDAGLKTGQLEKAFETVCDLEDVEFPTGDAQRPDVKGVWRQVDRFWAQLSKLLPVSIDPKTTCKVQERAVRFRRELRIANTRRERVATLVQLLTIWAPQPDVVLKHWIDDPKCNTRTGTTAKALHAKFRDDVVTPFMDAWRQYLYRVVVTLLTEARATASAARMRQNTLNYNDLLFKSAKLLRERPDVRKALQTKFRWLFVDEFQDTDPVQAEIVFLLAADEGAHSAANSSTNGTTRPDPIANREPRTASREAQAANRQPLAADWRTVALRSGALFVVGDPKQSIYRFRRADIEIYNLVRARITDSANGAVVPLTTNFRSTAALCDWANSVFKSQFPSVATPQSPQYAPLEAASGARVDTVRHEADSRKSNSSGVQAQGAGVCTMTVAEDVDWNSVAEVEAQRIARFIRSEVDCGHRTYGDFLILTRKRRKNRLLPYVQALEALQIPMEVSGAGAFAESREVKALALLLRTLSDPQDSVPLVGVLRGPLFGVSDRELFSFKEAGGWFSIFCEVDEGGPVAAAFKALRQYHRWTRVLPPPAAVERMLEHTGYLALATTTPDGVEAGDLVHAVDRVRQVMETRAVGLAIPFRTTADLPWGGPAPDRPRLARCQVRRDPLGMQERQELERRLDCETERGPAHASCRRRHPRHCQPAERLHTLHRRRRRPRDRLRLRGSGRWARPHESAPARADAQRPRE